MRVVVTGVGVVSALGPTTADFRQALRESRSGLATITRFDTDWFFSKVGAEVKPMSFDHVAGESEQRHLDNHSLFCLSAADEAVRQAGFVADEPFRCGVFLGTGMGPSETWAEAYRGVHLEQRKPRPTTVPRCMFNAPVGHLSIRYNLRGPSQMIVTACSSSAHAIGQALLMIRHGLCDAALVGGTETFPAYGMWAAWDTLRVMSRSNDAPARACRPFAKDRDGFVMGEGAAVMVIETAARAAARGAEPLAEIAGVGMSSDAHHITQPARDGFEAALRGALADAGLAPEDIDYINAHGTGTPTNDPLEVAAIRGVFGAHADKLAVSSTKGAHGHTIGAAGAMEAVATVLGLHEGWVPPTLHLDEPDPACDLDHVPHKMREMLVRAALSNSFAFGGHNVVLAFRRAGE